MTYQQQKNKLEAAAETNATEVNERLLIADFFANHEELIQCDAADKTILEYLSDTAVTAAVLEDA
jgi:hypothetical protein